MKSRIGNERGVLVAHPGTQYAFNLASELERRNALFALYTGMAIPARGALGRTLTRLPGRRLESLRNRVVDGVPARKIHTRPAGELLALAKVKLGGDPQEVFYFRNAAFQRGVPDKAIREADAVIGFDTSSWILARRACVHDRRFILDQSIGHPRAFATIAARLCREYPDWAVTIPVKTNAELMREDEEHRDASAIVAPSRFVAKTLQENGVDAARIRVNPFGVDLKRFRPAHSPPSLKVMRFVFVGSLHPRKGLPLLLRVWKDLERRECELWIVGGGQLPGSVRATIPDSVRFFGYVPKAQLPSILQKCHVFVFPSYFEGLAQVQIEAAACGLPVVGTDSSGCAELICDGENGFVLPVGDVESLRSTLQRFISSPELSLTMRDRLLRQRAAWSWKLYGDRWAEILLETT